MSGYSPDEIHAAVREHYAARASQPAVSEACCAPDCCGDEAYYSIDQIAGLPVEVAGFSLGCGNPASQAPINEGDTVLDLGSGGGLDCFLAAKRVGPAGRVIGVDMTPAMLERARANARRLGAANVEFRQGQIEALPVEDASVDVILSNCVINLSPDKPQVFREMFRALRAGGRVSVSDIVTDGPMASEVAGGLEEWAACVAGALDAADYRAGLKAAGFVDVRVAPREAANGPGLPFSALITARKPAG